MVNRHRPMRQTSSSTRIGVIAHEAPLLLCGGHYLRARGASTGKIRNKVSQTPILGTFSFAVPRNPDEKGTAQDGRHELAMARRERLGPVVTRGLPGIGDFETNQPPPRRVVPLESSDASEDVEDTLAVHFKRTPAADAAGRLEKTVVRAPPGQDQGPGPGSGADAPGARRD